MSKRKTEVIIKVNYRQWKKKYKKINGHNPLISKNVKLINNVIKELPVILGQVRKVFANVLKEIPKIIERTEENIRTMNDDKFEECLNKVDDVRLKAMAIAIRKGEKVNWF